MAKQAQQINFRVDEEDAAALKRVAQRTGRTQSAVLLEALRAFYAKHSARDAEDLAWLLANRYSPARPDKEAPAGDPRRLGLGPPALATFELAHDLSVDVAVEVGGKDAGTKLLEQHAQVVARREGGKVLVELSGHPFSPEFAGVVLPVGSLPSAGGSLRVRLQDLAPSLAE